MSKTPNAQRVDCQKLCMMGQQRIAPLALSRHQTVRVPRVMAPLRPAVGHHHPMPAKQRTDRSKDDGHPPGIGRLGTRLLEISENVVYAGIAAFLVGTALVCLVLAGKVTWGLASDFSEQPILDLLDILLLVFIVVELLFAVRSTVEKRELLAEPFLLVGIIASIKEIVVLSVEAAKEVGNGAEFRDRIAEIAVLGVLVLLLGVTSFLLRRKEREPDEGASGPPAPERQVD
jgi:uncharacterized membrane protein (DUF373 family)